MNSEWCKEEVNPEQMKAAVKAAQPVLDKGVQILEKQLAASLKAAASKDGFGTAAWPYKQAHYLGEQQALRKVITLLNLGK